MTSNNRLPIVIKGYLARAALLLAFGLLAQASFAHDVACGSASNANANILLSTAWTTLRGCTLDLSDGVHSCVVTASADIDNPFGPNDQNRYRFTTAVDTTVPAVDGAFERTAVLNNNAGIRNPDSTSVTTVEEVTLSAGTHSFRALGRKMQAGTSNGTVTDSSMGVVCVDADPNANPNDDANDGSNSDSSVDLQ